MVSSKSLATFLNGFTGLPRLLTANALADRLGGMISAERLTELALLGVLPCVRIAEGPPLFHLTFTKEFIRDNLLSLQEGAVFPRIVGIPTAVADRHSVPPAELRPLIGMVKELSEWSVGSGIYFLCFREQVVYVGQSSEVARRIGEHLGKKYFDQVFYVSCPMAELDRTEAAFIRVLRPMYNTESVSKPLANDADRAIVARFMVAAEASSR